MQEIRDEATRALIADEIANHGAGIAEVFAEYDPSDTVGKWHATTLAIEEFINVPLFGLDDDRLVAVHHALSLDERLFANPKGPYFEASPRNSVPTWRGATP